MIHRPEPSKNEQARTERLRHNATVAQLTNEAQELMQQAKRVKNTKHMPGHVHKTEALQTRINEATSANSRLLAGVDAASEGGRSLAATGRKLSELNEWVAVDGDYGDTNLSSTKTLNEDDDQ